MHKNKKKRTTINYPLSAPIHVSLDVAEVLRNFVDALDVSKISPLNIEDKNLLFYIPALIYSERLVFLKTEWSSGRDESWWDEWHPFMAKYLQEAMGSTKLKGPWTTKYKAAVEISKSLGIIECDEFFIKGRKCYNYRIGRKFCSDDLVAVQVDCKSAFGKRIWNCRMKARSAGYRLLGRDVCDLIVYNANKLSVSNYKDALEHAKQLAETKESEKRKQESLREATRCLNALNDHAGFYVKFDRNGRFYCPFSNLKKELRKHIVFDGMPLVEIDVSCSHPFLMIHEAERLGRVSREFRDTLIMLSSESDLDFYDELRNVDVPIIPHPLAEFDRNMTKRAVSAWNSGCPLAFSNDAKAIDQVMFWLAFDLFAFKWAQCGVQPLGCFERKPSFLKVKALSVKLANKLMRLEADVVVRSTLKSLMKIDRHFPVVPLHDALYTTEAGAENVKEALTQSYQAHYGILPKIKIKELSQTS